MLKKFLSALTLFVLLLNNLSSQSLSGTVVDAKTEETLVAASIRMLTTNKVLESEIRTDANGHFSIIMPSDTFEIQISYIGYFSQSLKVKKEGQQDINLGKIALEEDHKTLNEVTVTGDAEIKVIGKSILYPNQLQVKSADNGLRLLKNLDLDGLFIDPINQAVKSTYASEVIFKINGIESDLKQTLALKPELVERIEYTSTPSGRYASRDAAVVNYVLKEQQMGTYIFVSATNGPTTGFANSTASIRSVYGKSQLSLDYNLSWRSYTKPLGNSQTEYHFPTETLYRHEEYDDAPFHYTDHNFNLGYLYHDEKNTFSAKLIANIQKYRGQINSDIYDNQLKDIDIKRHTHTKDNQVTPSLDLFYKHLFSKKRSLEINMVGTMMNTNYEKQLTDNYLQKENLEEKFFQDTDGRKRSMIVEGIYSNEENDNFNYSAGLRGMYSHTKNTYIFDNIAKLRQIEVYPYAEVTGKINHLRYQLSTGLKVLDMNNFTDKRKYYRNLSTFNLFFKKNNTWSIQNYLRYNPEYPSLGSMSKVDQVENSIIVVRGNPDIKPAHNIYNILSFNVKHKKLSIRSSLFAQKTFDAILSDIFYDNQLDAMVRHSDNTPYSANYGARMGVNLDQLSDIFSLRMGGNWTGYKSKMNDVNYSFNQWQWYVGATMQYKNFSAEVGYHSPNKSMYGHTIVLHENYSELSLMYKVRNWTFNAGVYWPLTSGSKYGSQSLSKVAPSKSVRYIRDNKNMLILGFSYNINWGKSIFNLKQSIENQDTDRGILN